MSKHRIAINYLNPLLLIAWPVLFMLFVLIIIQPSTQQFLNSSGYSQRFIEDTLIGVVVGWIGLLFITAFYIWRRHVEVTIDSEGINATWFSVDASVLSKRFKRRSAFTLRRKKKLNNATIRWQDIEKYYTGNTSTRGFLYSFIIVTKDGNCCWFGRQYYGFRETPRDYKEMIVDFEKYFTDAYEKGIATVSPEDAYKPPFSGF